MQSREAEEIIGNNPRWDQRFWNLQVTDAKADAIELRLLMTARDASIAFDLRCDVREAMMAFIANEMPQAIVRRRILADGRLDDGFESPNGSRPRTSPI